MSVRRVLGKLSNHVIEAVFVNMKEDTYMVLRSAKLLRVDGSRARKIKALARSRAYY